MRRLPRLSKTAKLSPHPSLRNDTVVIGAIRLPISSAMYFVWRTRLRAVCMGDQAGNQVLGLLAAVVEGVGRQK